MSVEYSLSGCVPAPAAPHIPGCAGDENFAHPGAATPERRGINDALGLIERFARGAIQM
jgi:hypothetical protein